MTKKLESQLAEIDQVRLNPADIPDLALAAAAASQENQEWCRAALRTALSRGTPPDRVREAVLQTHLFAGFPRAINALADLAYLAPLPENSRIELGHASEGEREHLEQGQKLCRKVYGEGYEKLLRVMAQLSPDLGRWMLVDGYGKVLSRPLLEPKTRELCAVSALAVLHVPAQLRAHVRGALFVGASAPEVSVVLDIACWIRPDQKELCRRTLDEAVSRKTEPPSTS